MYVVDNYNDYYDIMVFCDAFGMLTIYPIQIYTHTCDNYGYYNYDDIPSECIFKKPDVSSLWPALAEVFNLRCRLLISLMTNVFAATFYRREIFSKSGFVGRVAKRRKGKG